jgi:Glycosyl hydrolases family 43
MRTPSSRPIAPIRASCATVTSMSLRAPLATRRTRTRSTPRPIWRPGRSSGMSFLPGSGRRGRSKTSGRRRSTSWDRSTSANGLSLLGTPSTLITNDQPWEGAVTEAPFMVDQGGTFYLFYSGDSYANATYAVGIARASAPTGPFTKASAPTFVTGGGVGRPRALCGGRYAGGRHRDGLRRVARRVRQ